MMKGIAALAVAAVALFATGAAQPRTHAPTGPLGLVGDGTTSSLVRLNAKNLRPLPGQRLDLGLFAGAWAYSPDRAMVALGLWTGYPDTAPQASLRFVDVNALSSRGDLPLGAGYVDATAWLAPDRLAALVVRPAATELLVVDPGGRRVLATTAIDSAWSRAEQAGGRLVVLSRRGDGQLSLTVVDSGGTVQSVHLDRLRQGLPALAVTLDGRRAFVVSGSGLIADVDTSSLSVSYHGEAESAARDAAGARRYAEVLPTGELAVAGSQDVRYVDSGQDRTRHLGTGLVLVSTSTWMARRVDYSSSRFTVFGNSLLATGSTWGGGTFTIQIGGPSPPQPQPVGDGLKAYTLAGDPRFHRFDGKDVYVLQTYDKRSFVFVAGSGTQLQVVDVRTGKVVGTRRYETLPWILQGPSSTG
jgi:hypothetical protein